MSLFRIYQDGMVFIVVLVSDRGERWPFTPPELLAKPSFHVFGKIIYIIFTLTESDGKHKLALRGIIETVGREAEVNDLTDINKIDNLSSVNTVAGKPVRMPC